MRILKLVLATTSLFLLANTALKAQYNDPSRLYVGGQLCGHVPFIVNQTNYGLPEMSYAVNAPSIGGGIIAGIYFSSTLQLQGEVSFSRMGQEYKDNYSYIAGSFQLKKKITMDYFQVPLLLRFVVAAQADKVYMDDKPKLYFIAGPQISLLTAASYQYFVDGTPATWQQVDDRFGSGPEGAEIGNAINGANKKVVEPKNALDLYEKISIELVGGMGLEKMINENILLNIEGRAFFGFNDINAVNYQVKNRSNVYAGSHNFSMSIRIGAAYVF